MRWSFVNLSIWVIVFTCGLLVFECQAVDNFEPNNDPVQNSIDRAAQFFEEGRIVEAEHLAFKTLSKPELLSKDQKFNLYRILAFCSIANDDEEGGERYFKSALMQNPNMSPDPLLWSPKIRRVFDRAKSSFNIIQEDIKKQHLSREADFCRRASLKSLIIPGYGQLVKGQKTKSYATGLLFAGAASAFLYELISYPEARDAYFEATNSSDAEATWKEYRDAQYYVNISGLLTLAIYSYSFFDALWAHPSLPDSSFSSP